MVRDGQRSLSDYSSRYSNAIGETMNRLSTLFCLIVGLTIAFFFNHSAEATAIRIGVLPVVESLPFLVAQERGLFHSSELKVEIISFASALERDAPSNPDPFMGPSMISSVSVY